MNEIIKSKYKLNSPSKNVKMYFRRLKEQGTKLNDFTFKMIWEKNLTVVSEVIFNLDIFIQIQIVDVISYSDGTRFKYRKLQPLPLYFQSGVQKFIFYPSSNNTNVNFQNFFNYLREWGCKQPQSLFTHSLPRFCPSLWGRCFTQTLWAPQCFKLPV